MAGKRRSLTDVIRTVAEQEALGQRQFAREALERGPLHALRRMYIGDFGGPLTRAFFRVPALGFLGTRRGFVLFVVGGPVVITLGLLRLMDLALEDGSRVLQLGLAAILMSLSVLAAVVLFLLALRSTRSSVLRRVGRWSLGDILWWSVLLVAIPTVGFAALGALLAHEELVGFKGPSPDSAKLSLYAFETLAWSLTDSLPILKVPETLSWERALEFTTPSGGAVVLAYKLVLIVPLVQLIGLILNQGFGQTAADPVQGGGEEPQQETP